MGERQLVSGMCLAACVGPVCTLPPPQGSQAHVSQVYNLQPALKEAARDGVHDSGGSLFPKGSNLSAVKAPLHMGLSRSFLYTFLTTFMTQQIKSSSRRLSDISYIRFGKSAPRGAP